MIYASYKFYCDLFDVTFNFSDYFTNTRTNNVDEETLKNTSKYITWTS